MPSLYLVLLYSARHRLNPPGTDLLTAQRVRTSDPSVQAISFLWADYLPQFYFFEVVEPIRRMALTGIPVTIQGPDEMGWRRVFVLVLAFIFFVIYRESAPFQYPETNALSNICQLQIIVTLFVCLLLGLDEFNDTTLGGWEFYGPLLTTLNTITGGITCVLNYYYVKKAKQEVSARAGVVQSCPGAVVSACVRACLQRIRAPRGAIG